MDAFCEEGGGRKYQYGETTADFRQSPKAEAKYGPVGLWDISEVTNMLGLFYRCTTFNEDTGRLVGGHRPSSIVHRPTIAP